MFMWNLILFCCSSCSRVQHMTTNSSHLSLPTLYNVTLLLLHQRWILFLLLPILAGPCDLCWPIRCSGHSICNTESRPQKVLKLWLWPSWNALLFCKEAQDSQKEGNWDTGRKKSHGQTEANSSQPFQPPQLRFHTWEWGCLGPTSKLPTECNHMSVPRWDQEENHQVKPQNCEEK